MENQMLDVQNFEKNLIKKYLLERENMRGAYLEYLYGKKQIDSRKFYDWLKKLQYQNKVFADWLKDLGIEQYQNIAEIVTSNFYHVSQFLNEDLHKKFILSGAGRLYDEKTEYRFCDVKADVLVANGVYKELNATSVSKLPTDHFAFGCIYTHTKESREYYLRYYTTLKRMLGLCRYASIDVVHEPIDERHSVYLLHNLSR